MFPNNQIQNQPKLSDKRSFEDKSWSAVTPAEFLPYQKYSTQKHQELILTLIEYQPETPKKPPKMKYKDLPMYESPHKDYKEQIEAQKYPEAYRKLLHEKLKPHVKSFQNQFCASFCELYCGYLSIKYDVKQSLRKKKNEFMYYMRDPENTKLRQAVVLLGGLSGLAISSKKPLPVCVISTGAGFLTAGALCFPEGTDIFVRNASYFLFEKILIPLYNLNFGKNFKMPNVKNCMKDIPPDTTKSGDNRCGINLNEHCKYKKQIEDIQKRRSCR